MHITQFLCLKMDLSPIIQVYITLFNQIIISPVLWKYIEFLLHSTFVDNRNTLFNIFLFTVLIRLLLNFIYMSKQSYLYELLNLFNYFLFPKGNFIVKVFLTLNDNKFIFIYLTKLSPDWVRYSRTGHCQNWFSQWLFLWPAKHKKNFIKTAFNTKSMHCNIIFLTQFFMYQKHKLNSHSNVHEQR